ncbi:hypothetical protein ACSBR2_038120 [Camellia fascicularis]
MLFRRQSHHPSNKIIYHMEDSRIIGFMSQKRLIVLLVLHLRLFGNGGIDDKVLIEIFLEGGSEFTSIVLDVGSGFDCQPVALLPTEVELQFHGSADVNEKDAIFNYRRKYLPIQQISGMEQTSFLFQQAS